MPKFSLFKSPKHRKFEYRPMYWDPKKDRTEAFKRRISQIREENIEGSKARISSGLKTGYGANPKLRAQLNLRSNIRILGIISILVLLSFYLINRYLDEIILWLAGGS